MIAYPRQEAHLVSSLQDLFKDQEKRITTAVLVAWYATTNSSMFFWVKVPETVERCSARIVCLLYH